MFLHPRRPLALGSPATAVVMILVLTAAIASALSPAQEPAWVPSPKKLIVDTDLMTDVDDAAALLLALTHPRANLLAALVNERSYYSALAASALVAYYRAPGAPAVPVGARRPLTSAMFCDTRHFVLGEYASKVAYHWRDLPGAPLEWARRGEDAWDPARLYRTVLAGHDNVTIVSIGYLDNISALLNSTADDISPLSGPELVRRSVAELVVMGGDYPAGREWNFCGDDPARTAHVVNTWASLALAPVTFFGFSMGAAVRSGGMLMARARADPVAAAYRWYTYGRPAASWDPLTVLYAIEGLAGGGADRADRTQPLFEYGNEGGYNQVDPVDGSNTWVEDDESRDQHWLRLRVDAATAGRQLEKLYLEGAKRGGGTRWGGVDQGAGGAEEEDEDEGGEDVVVSLQGDGEDGDQDEGYAETPVYLVELDTRLEKLQLCFKSGEKNPSWKP